ncbi:hypothetical protein BCR34DRAFT_166338 [Clohesyomyces aquaticus]|uniref:Uncharacterized protein n=1 Tax=Clohesyomyces aquaticus TaxID=1231657 RepID=A0A1Y1YHJ6_9PLEO|nr:hypothetical protein BCR34DRAFT_166338 [Clohesyomyces aquaticus]
MSLFAGECGSSKRCRRRRKAGKRRQTCSRGPSVLARLALNHAARPPICLLIRPSSSSPAEIQSWCSGSEQPIHEKHRYGRPRHPQRISALLPRALACSYNHSEGDLLAEPHLSHFHPRSATCIPPSHTEAPSMSLSAPQTNQLRRLLAINVSSRAVYLCLSFLAVMG